MSFCSVYLTFQFIDIFLSDTCFVKCSGFIYPLTEVQLGWETQVARPHRGNDSSSIPVHSHVNGYYPDAAVIIRVWASRSNPLGNWFITWKDQLCPVMFPISPTGLPSIATPIQLGLISVAWAWAQLGCRQTMCTVWIVWNKREALLFN